MNNLFQTLPAIHRFLEEINDAVTPHALQVHAARQALERGRQWILDRQTSPTQAQLQQWYWDAVAVRQASSLQSVINATGVIVHTNLGRAPLSEATQHAMLRVAQGYSNLEYDLEIGKRGRRQTHISDLLREITGAEAGVVVNNNAAAVYLVLNTFAQGREIIVSRGQLVEIGGGFRIPDVMRNGGAILREVGTTNRTRVSDYEAAITENTFALMRIHSSNFKQIGFTESASIAEMVKIAHAHDVAVVDDLGSGTLINTETFGLAYEPTVQESIQAGADIISFSGDKLLGGPQAGLIIGKQHYIDQLKKHPLMRALRPDKTTIAGLTQTLMHYRDEEAHKIPVWSMIGMPLEQIKVRCIAWQKETGGEIVEATSTVGGGSLPGDTLPSFALALDVPCADAFLEKLRQAKPPIIARIQHGRVLFDPRTVFPAQDELFSRIIKNILLEQ